MRLALLVALCVSLAPWEMRVTRTVTGVRLRVTGVHAQPVQLFVVGGTGLRVFRHERLDRQRDGSFVADLVLVDAGLYMAYVEFTPDRGSPQMVQQAFSTGDVLMPRAGEPVDEPHEANGLSATIDASRLKAGAQTALAFDVSDAVAPASAGLFLVSADLTEAQHLQARDAPAGTHLVFSPIVPRAGRYKLWLMIQRGGRTVAIPFAIDVN